MKDFTTTIQFENVGNRQFSKEALTDAFKRFQKQIDDAEANNNAIYGHIIDPSITDDIFAQITRDVREITHKINSIEIYDNKVDVKCTALDTPIGKLLQSVIDNEPIYGCKCVMMHDKDDSKCHILSIDVVLDNGYAHKKQDKHLNTTQTVADDEPLTEEFLFRNGWKKTNRYCVTSYRLYDESKHSMFTVSDKLTIQVAGRWTFLSTVGQLRQALLLCGLNDIASNLK